MDERNTLSMNDRKHLTRIVEHTVDDIMPYYVGVIREANQQAKVSNKNFWLNLFVEDIARMDGNRLVPGKTKYPLLKSTKTTSRYPIPADPYLHMDIQLCSKYLLHGHERVSRWNGDHPIYILDSNNFFRFVEMDQTQKANFTGTLYEAIDLRNSRKHETLASYQKMSLEYLAKDVITLSKMMEPFRNLKQIPGGLPPAKTVTEKLHQEINACLGGCPTFLPDLCKDVLADQGDPQTTRIPHIRKLLDLAGFRQDGDYVIVDCEPMILTQAVLRYLNQTPGEPTAEDAANLKTYIHPPAEPAVKETAAVCAPVQFSQQVQTVLRRQARCLSLQSNAMDPLFRNFHLVADESVFLCAEGRNMLIRLIPVLKPLGVQLKLDYSVIAALHLGYRRSKPLPLELLSLHDENAAHVHRCQEEAHANYKMALKVLRRLREENCIVSAASPTASSYSDENICNVASAYPNEHFLVLTMHRYLAEKLSGIPSKNAVAAKVLLDGKNLLLWGETYPMWQHTLGTVPPVETPATPSRPCAEAADTHLPKIFGKLEALDASGNRSSVVLTKKLSEGGEGTVYLTNHPGGLVAKIYHPKKTTSARTEKLEYMVRHNPKIPNLAWPCALLFDQEQKPIGYLMPMVPGKVLEDVVFHPGKNWRNIKNMGWSRRHLAQVGANIAGTFALLHQNDMLMGDVNPRNIMVTEDCSVYFVDCDSYQFGGFECPVGKPDYTPPEVHKRMRQEGITEYRYIRTEYNEIYSLAVLLFSILLPGRAPYAARNAGYSDVVDAVIAGYFPYPYGGDENAAVKGNMMAPAGVFRNIWSHMTWKMKTHFYETFTQTGASRRNARQWEQALTEYIRQIELNHTTDELEPTGYKETSRDGEEAATKLIDRVCTFCNQKYNIAEDVYLRRKGKFEQDFCGKHYQMMQNFRKRPIRTTCSRCAQEYQTSWYDVFVRDSTDAPQICDNCENVTVICADCGISYRRNRQQVEDLRKRGRSIICPECYNRRFSG